MAGTHWVASFASWRNTFRISPFELPKEIIQCQCLLLQELGDSASLTTDRRASKSQAAPTRLTSYRLPVGNPKPLRKLGHQLGPFALGPSSGGAGAHVSQRTGCKREFGDMVPERCFGDDKEIMLARGEINFLDLDPNFLGEFSRRLTALRGVPDRANSLVGPVDRQYECRHVVLHRSDRLIACRSRGRPTCSMLKLRERHKGRRCVQTASLPTARCPFQQAATSARPVLKGSSSHITRCHAPEKGAPAFPSGIGWDSPIQGKLLIAII